jgi:hypothetical protein
MKLLLPWKSNKYYIFCACVALVIQHKKRMGSIVLSYVAWAVRLYHVSPRYLTNCTIFGKKVNWTRNVFSFSLQILSPTFLILRRIQRNIVINVKCLRIKYPILLSDLNGIWISSTDFRKKNSNIKYHQNLSSRSRVVPCGRTNRVTDKEKIKLWGIMIMYVAQLLASKKSAFCTKNAVTYP